MEIQMRIIAIALGITLSCIGCSTFGQWSPTAKADIDKFLAWSDVWVGGALKTAPAAIAEIEVLTGKNDKTQAASAAVTAAVTALGALHAIAATGTGDLAAAQANLANATQAIDSTIYAAKQVAATVSGKVAAPVVPSR